MKDYLLIAIIVSSVVAVGVVLGIKLQPPPDHILTAPPQVERHVVEILVTVEGVPVVAADVRCDTLRIHGYRVELIDSLVVSTDSVPPPRVPIAPWIHIDTIWDSTRTRPVYIIPRR